jgi:hypothetical protein
LNFKIALSFFKSSFSLELSIRIFPELFKSFVLENKNILFLSFLSFDFPDEMMILDFPNLFF